MYIVVNNVSIMLRDLKSIYIQPSHLIVYSVGDNALFCQLETWVRFWVDCINNCKLWQHDVLLAIEGRSVLIP